MNVTQFDLDDRVIPTPVFTKYVVFVVQIFLMFLGAGVLFVWHHPGVSTHSTQITEMAYNTAVCILFSALTLFAILRQQTWLLRLCALVIMLIGGLTLLEFFTGYSFDINHWFSRALTRLPPSPTNMTPTSAICFVLIGCALLGLSSNLHIEKNRRLIAVVFLNLSVVTITFIALMGHGIGVTPAFVWLGIKMAPHTAIALGLFSATVIFIIHRDAFRAFNQLNFFRRIIIGFGFMASLVIAIGSVAYMQIHTVSGITHELYRNPLQINNAAVRIKSQVNHINRELKNIAIRPESSTYQQIPLHLQQAQLNIQKEMDLIRNNDTSTATELVELDEDLKEWQHYVLASYQLLDAKLFDDYSSRILHEGQEQIVGIENILEHIINTAQTHISDLDKSVVNTEQDAKKLVFIMVFAFLVMGVSVAIFITRSLTDQLKQLRLAMLDIAHENTKVKIPFLRHPQEIGDMARTLEIFVDNIAERKKSAAALDKSRERLELTARVNQIGVWEYNIDKDEMIWDDIMFDIYGCSSEDFTGNYAFWRDHIHSDDLAKTEQKFNESIAELAPFIKKFRIVSADGSIRFVQAKAKVERNSDSGNIRVLGTAMDITREEMVFAKLHNLEVLRSAIVEYSEDAIISKTPQGIITSWNISAENMFGYTEAEVIGKSITSLLFPPELVHEGETLLQKVRAGGVVKHFETLRRCKDGRMINVSITLSPIKDAKGNVIGISAIKRDISESLKNARMLAQRQRELESMNDDLQRTNKELETFAYVASHDLKSPLRGISQLSTWIEEDIGSRDFSSVTSHTGMLRNRIQRMEKLLDDLLLFYRAGKIEGSLNTIDVRKMATEIFDIQNFKPGLTFISGENLPVFTTLGVPFEQVIRNLFSNAIKHHDLEQGLIRMDCKNIDDDFFEFSVCDDGPGIPEKFQQRVYGMFQTLKPRDEMEGSGMGLALIKKIVENYGGHVGLVSEGRGCCFSFSWPKNIRRIQKND